MVTNPSRFSSDFPPLSAADPGAAGAQPWPPGALRRPAAARRGALEAGHGDGCATGERGAAGRQIGDGRFDVELALNVSGSGYVMICLIVPKLGSFCSTIVVSDDEHHFFGEITEG